MQITDSMLNLFRGIVGEWCLPRMFDIRSHCPGPGGPQIEELHSILGLNRLQKICMD